jgi:Zn-dependent peptidase ImmA (M78 family)/DNA-binding XRE family transcriptional regulator
MNANILDSINPRELGAELKRTRESRNLTQQQAADILNVARTTITAIENGDRRIKASELIQLARAYGRDVGDFIRKERPKSEPFQPQFRSTYQAAASLKQIDPECINEFEDLCRSYYELEKITGNILTYNYPDVSRYTIVESRIDQMAENIALQERNRLGLGDAPISFLRELLEREVGLRIFYIKIAPAEFSAMYAYDTELGGCIAANILHPIERQRWSIAHEFAHFLAQRYEADLVGNEYKRLPSKERFADAFASYFLLPTGGLLRQIGNRPIRRTDLFELSNYFGVSVEALTRRLESIEIIPRGTFDDMRRRGIKFRELQQQLSLTPISEQNSRLPARYQYLAIMAVEKEFISEGQFTRFMGVSRTEARRIIESLKSPNGEALNLYEYVDRQKDNDGE